MVNESGVINNQNIKGNTDITEAITGGVVEVSVTGTSEQKIVNGTITSNSLTGTINNANIEGTVEKGGYSQTEETDPTVPSYVKSITEEDINNWNNKSDFGGSYNDLIDKPNIPDKTSDLKNDSGFITGYTETDPTIPKHIKEITEEDIEKWNNPKTEIELSGGDNTVIEDNAINVYTNTGYKVSDKDIQLQTITDSGTTGTNKMVYIDDEEIIILYDGTNKIRRSENGIDFKTIELPYACKSMIYNSNSKRLFGLTNGYFLISKDTGFTWEVKQSTFANNANYIIQGQGHVDGFLSVNKTTRRIYALTENGEQNGGYVTSTISPDFVTRFEQYRYIWCNSSGTFKYGAGSSEGTFASISGVTVNMLKTVNSKQIIGLKNDNKIYIIKNPSGTTDNEWIPYLLPDTCTVNDITFNPYDETYYIFTDINTYYKTKDFVEFEPVDKNGLRGIQGYFTSMGIQMTTSNHNELLLSPTRTKIENKFQELDRLAKKELWVSDGLKLTEEGKVKVESIDNALVVSNNGLILAQISEYNLTEDMLEGLYVARAEEKGLFDPYEIENWYWGGEAYPEDKLYKAVKFVFSQAGSFYNLVTWEEEYSVEQYEYGYLFYDVNMMIFKYVKLGNLSWMFN